MIRPAGRISRVIDIPARQGHVVPSALVHHRGTYIANLGVFDPSDGTGDEHVWRLTPHPTLRVHATGVEKVLGLAFRDGKLYVLEMNTTAGGPTPGTGAIVQLGPSGPVKTIVSGLTFPTGMTVGFDEAFYVSNQGLGFGPARRFAARPARARVGVCKVMPSRRRRSSDAIRSWRRCAAWWPPTAVLDRCC
jgi:hypothetical protein